MSDSFVEAIRNCANCGKEFLARTRWTAQSLPKHCSQKCRYASRSNSAAEFWASVNKTESCWLWTRPPAADGYGVITFQGKIWRAPRLAWTLTNGPIPDGMFTLHDCPGGDNPLCVRPSHLYLGGHAENSADRAKKGQTTAGEKTSYAVLNNALVLAMREEHKILGTSAKAIADRLGLNRGTVRDAIYKQTWKHLP